MLYDTHTYLLFMYLIVCGTTYSTFFPYTTLFRSAEVVTVLTHDTDRRVRPCPEPGCRRPLLRQWRPVPSVEPGSISRDRKSTRLNSSHVAISYAVFCL